MPHDLLLFFFLSNSTFSILKIILLKSDDLIFVCLYFDLCIICACCCFFCVLYDFYSVKSSPEIMIVLLMLCRNKIQFFLFYCILIYVHVPYPVTFWYMCYIWWSCNNRTVVVNCLFSVSQFVLMGRFTATCMISVVINTVDRYMVPYICLKHFFVWIIFDRCLDDNHHLNLAKLPLICNQIIK